MQLRAFASTLKYVVIGATAGIAIAGVHIAIGQSHAVPQIPAIDGWRVSGAYDSKLWPEMKFTVSVENTLDKDRDLQFSVKLVRREFTGNPMARTLQPNAVTQKDLEIQKLSGKVRGGRVQNFIVTFKAKPDKENKPADGIPRVNYMAAIDLDGKTVAWIVAQSNEPTLNIEK